MRGAKKTTKIIIIKINTLSTPPKRSMSTEQWLLCRRRVRNPRNKPETPKKMQLTNQLATKISPKTDEDFRSKLENCLLNNKKIPSKTNSVCMWAASSALIQSEERSFIEEIEKRLFFRPSFALFFFGGRTGVKKSEKRKEKRRVVCAGGKQLQEEKEKKERQLYRRMIWKAQCEWMERRRTWKKRGIEGN